jgi:hypothetical protein
MRWRSRVDFADRRLPPCAVTCPECVVSIFLGFCHVRQRQEHVRLIAACFCAHPAEYEARLRADLAMQGLHLAGVEDVLPEDRFVARYPASAGAMLARAVHAGRRVALGPTGAPRAAESAAREAQAGLRIAEIGPVEPLGAQFGVRPKKTVPDALREALFGQPAPTKAERARFAEDIPPLATYAVLDAAKLPYLLIGLLETSGLRHQSLFQGETQEELGEYAPYLVELTEDNDFTRRLFTGPDGVGGLWEKKLGIYLRSRAGFDSLRKHLRRFTRLRTEQSTQWYFFRFWDPVGRRSRCLTSCATALRWRPHGS